ncbi:hypothetical protein [Apilactobacillus xinyiensis]|uniref:hypothetical protein n=1 Tax=Apilactobacillus xinyiensis TaxID=2841032 RepID=UPI00200D6668|nr:hypothetical protein [Apilactobacillus xinyiensis]MCL0319387.1 hypothetical protein [Apilactobacillus xinyiensis]
MQHVGVYITNHLNKTVELPVAPAEMTIKKTTDDKKETVVKLGEVNRIGDNKLIEFSINIVIPTDIKHCHYLTAKNTLSNGNKYITFLDKIYKSKKPCRVVLTTTSISVRATLNLEYGFKDGFAKEYACTLSFTEFKKFKAKKLKTTGKNKKVAKKGKSRKKPAHKKSRGSKVKINNKKHKNVTGRIVGKRSSASSINTGTASSTTNNFKVGNGQSAMRKKVHSNSYLVKHDNNLKPQYFFRKENQPKYKHPIKVPSGSIGFIKPTDIFNNKTAKAPQSPHSIPKAKETNKSLPKFPKINAFGG